MRSPSAPYGTKTRRTKTNEQSQREGRPLVIGAISVTGSTSSSRIVVGVDGSESSIDALRRAAVLSQALDAPLETVTTWEWPRVLGAFAAPEEWSPETDAKQIVETALAFAFPHGAPVNLTTTTIQGSPAGVLIEESKSAGMLVLGSRGHGGFVGLLLGSVSSACAEHAHCPVLVVHGGMADSE